MTGSGPIEVGMRQECRFAIEEDDVVLFARASRDDAAHHLDQEFAQASPLGGRVVHGVLLLGYASAVSTQLLERVDAHFVSTGYDAVRFRAPVILGEQDHVDVSYEVTDIDESGRSVTSTFEIVRADGRVCVTGRHLMKRID